MSCCIQALAIRSVQVLIMSAFLLAARQDATEDARQWQNEEGKLGVCVVEATGIMRWSAC